MFDSSHEVVRTSGRSRRRRATRVGVLASCGLCRILEFEGITFNEVLAKSALNAMPEGSGLPFRFTVNTFRGCSHACRYCFARPTHEYLDLDAGRDFDSQVVVKLNVAAVLRKRTVGAPGNRTPSRSVPTPIRISVAEGRYRLFGVITALAESGTRYRY